MRLRNKKNRGSLKSCLFTQKLDRSKEDVSSAFGNFIVSTANIQKCALYFFQFCSKFPEHINSRVKRRILQK